jgi:hypothetical protein
LPVAPHKRDGIESESKFQLPLDPSSDIIERELDIHSAALENEMGGDVLAFFGPILYGVEDHVRTAVEETKKNAESLSLSWRHTAGTSRLCSELPIP